MFRSTLSLIWDIVHQQNTANSFRHWDTNSSHVAMAAHESNCLPVWHANITSDSSVMVSSMSAWREWATHPCPEALSRQSKKYRRSKLNGLESSHRHWFGRRSKAFRGVRLVPLVMAGVEPWKEGELYQCEAWGRERERESGLNVSVVLICWLLCIQTLLRSSFMTPLGRICEAEGHREREVPFFFSPPWFHESLDFPLREACFYVTFPALFFSPPSHFLQPQGSQLASLSGCLLSGSEGSSNCALTPRLLASQVTHMVTSPPLFCCSQTRVAGGEIINHGALRYLPPPNHRHCNSLSAICWL